MVNEFDIWTVNMDSSHLNFTTMQLPHEHNYNRPKASNIPATALIIGDWKCESCNTGDLMAKIYYGRRRLVWEVLVGAFKWKMEIKWSHIIGIKANQQRGILQIQLNQHPSFFRETHTQPRKHTTWEPSNDFTGGHALVSRIHCLEFPPNTLDKHYIQLLQCDERLLALSSSCQSQESDPYNYNFNESSLHAQGTRFPPQQYLTNYPTRTTPQDFTVSPAAAAVINHQHRAQQQTIKYFLEGNNNNIVQGATLMLDSNYYDLVEAGRDANAQMEQMNKVDDDDDSNCDTNHSLEMEHWNAINMMTPQECLQWLMTPQVATNSSPNTPFKPVV